MSTYIFVLSLLLLSLTMISVVLFFLFLLAAVAVAAAVCLFVCMFLFFPFAKLVLFRFLSWFSSLTCSIYIHVTFFCTLVLASTNIFYYIPVNLCHFFVYLKVDGGQLESRCYFDHHTHFLTCIVIILSCNHVL